MFVTMCCCGSVCKLLGTLWPSSVESVHLPPHLGRPSGHCFGGWAASGMAAVSQGPESVNLALLSEPHWPVP